MASEWNKLVTKVYHDNKHKEGYSLKDAMKEASAIRKGTKSEKVEGGGKGKSRRTKKRSGGKKRRTVRRKSRRRK